MFSVERYHAYSQFQQDDALACLKEYNHSIHWNGADRVADVGSGDAVVTTTILKKFMPTTFEKLTGFDINENMVMFANEHYSDERTSFQVLDIAGELPETLHGSFDHVFSFYTLHWIYDQQQAVDNIFHLLTKGGDSLLMFLGFHPWLEIFNDMVLRPKWSPYTRHNTNLLAPYYTMQAAERMDAAKNIMIRAGFNNVKVDSKEKSYIFNTTEACRNYIGTIIPYGIPHNLQEEFMDEYMETIRKMKLIREDNSVKINYGLLVAYGGK